MTKDLTIMLKSQPGTLSQISALLGKMGINIEGIAGMQAPDKDVIHLLLEDPEKAKALLEKEGINATIRDVLVVDVEGRKGAQGKIATLRTSPAGAHHPRRGSPTGRSSIPRTELLNASEGMSCI